MNFDDYEQLPTPSVGTNMIAGAAAGVLEHCVMYPMDSIKVILYVKYILLVDISPMIKFYAKALIAYI